MTNKTPTVIAPLGFNENSPFYDGDSDEYIISADGDISLSNIDFLPSLPTPIVSPVRQPFPSSKMPVHVKASPIGRSPVKNYGLPAVIQRILPPSPSKAGLVRDIGDADFGALVQLAREAHHRQESKAKSNHEEMAMKAKQLRVGAVLKKPTLTASDAARKSLLLPTRRPRPPKKQSEGVTVAKDGGQLQVQNATGSEENQCDEEEEDSLPVRPRPFEEQRVPQSSGSQQVVAPAGVVPKHEAGKGTPSVPPKKPRVSPKKGTRPLRGNAPLPRRPPLPRWDLATGYVHGGWITLDDELACSLASVSTVTGP